MKQVADPSQTYGGAQVSYDSLFSGGGAFAIDPNGWVLLHAGSPPAGLVQAHALAYFHCSLD